jgi:UDP-galactopyranose mutase
VYEPNGAHIFHTNNEAVARFARRFGMSRMFEHRVLTSLHATKDDEPWLLSWPPQIDELRRLPQWARIDRELTSLPAAPSGNNFEEYATSLMGATLYELFIYGYTVKQWGREPRELSSSFAPKRIDLRNDGDRRLFKDKFQYFEPAGFNSIIEAVAASATVNAEMFITIANMEELAREFDACVITAPLDEFLNRAGELAWRGIEMKSTYVPLSHPEDTVTAGYVVNYPDLRYPYTRTVETKHATEQRIYGSVVSKEFPGAPHRHYPVPTVEHTYEQRNVELQAEIRASTGTPVYFCGRLANYQYIDQDRAIQQGIDCAHQILEHVDHR